MPETTPPEKEFGFVLKDVARLMRQSFERRIAPLRLTQSQWRTLIWLSRAEGVNNVTLAERLDIRPITLTQTIDRLQAQGLVKRRPDPADRRAVQLYLTARAKPLLRKIDKIADATLEEAFAGMAAADRRRLMTLLSEVKQNLTAADPA
jgi:DNA-binding MarR family transcriptional regulator